MPVTSWHVHCSSYVLYPTTQENGGEMKLVKVIGAILLASGTTFAAETVSQNTESANAAPAQQPSMESSASLQKVAPATMPKSWGASYLNETRYGRAAAFNGTGSATLDHRFGITYKLSGGTLGLYQVWRQAQEIAGSKSAAVSALDPFVRYVFNTVALNHDWTLDPSVRFYVPTSETSRLNSQNGRFRTTLELKKPINGRLGLYYAFDGNYFFQKNLSTYKADGLVATPSSAKPGAGGEGERPGYKYDPNKAYNYYNIVGLDYQINGKWLFQQQIAVSNTYTYGDAAHGINHRNEDTFEVWSYLNYEPTKGVALILGLEQTRGSAERTAEPSYSFMADNETNYYLSLSVGI